jgi:hypothetical protein
MDGCIMTILLFGLVEGLVRRAAPVLQHGLEPTQQADRAERFEGSGLDRLHLREHEDTG